MTEPRRGQKRRMHMAMMEAFPTRDDCLGSALEAKKFLWKVQRTKWLRRFMVQELSFQVPDTFPWAVEGTLMKHTEIEHCYGAQYRLWLGKDLINSRYPKHVLLMWVAKLLIAAAGASSGPQAFRTQVRVFLALVQHHMGVATATRLRAALRKHKVRYHPPRTVTMPEEKKAALRSRMILMHQQKHPDAQGADPETLSLLALVLGRSPS